MPKININPNIADTPHSHILTIDEVRDMYGPPRTLGCPEDTRMALDSALYDGGVYSLLQHTIECGQGVLPQFMGYGALQNLAQNGLIRACIGTVADDMTREWIELQRSGEDAEDDGLITDITAAAETLNLKEVFHEAAELAGYEGGAFVFIDTGVSPDARINPLNMTRFSGELRRGSKIRFAAVDPVNVFPGTYNSTDPLAHDYYKPHDWWVSGQRVHSTRLLRFVANEVPTLLKPAYNFLGIPQAQILWDYVLHFQECRAAAARLLTKFSMTVFKTKLLDDVLFAGGSTAQLDARIRYAVQNMSNDGMFVIDKEEEDVVKVETPISGVTDVVRQALEFLAAINRTPAVKLLGISPSGFNATGESDIRNYYDHIAAMQNKVLREPLKKALDCIQLCLRGEIDPSVTFRFAMLGQEDEAAKAANRKTQADTIAVYLDRDVISPEEARKVIADDPDSGFSDIDPEGAPDSDDGQEETAVQMPQVPDKEDGEALDEDPEGVWKRTDNGQAILINPKGGEILKGNVGQKDDPFGPAFPGFAGKPKEAIEHLLKEKRGHVPGAFHKEGLGDIDLPYGHGGKRGYGIAHIIERREEGGLDGVAFVRRLPELIREGKLETRQTMPGRAYIIHKKTGAAIRLDWDGEHRNWIVTAYPQIEKTVAEDGLLTYVLTCDDKQRLPLPYHGSCKVTQDRLTVKFTDENA